MPPDYRQLLDDLARSRVAFERAQNAKPKPGRTRVEREVIANALAAARDDVARRESALWNAMPWDTIRRRGPESAEAMIQFLEANASGHVPGSSFGDLRRSFWRRLKQEPLDENQIQRLQRLAIRLCEGQSYRHEIREATRFLIRLADADFARELSQVLADPPRSSQGARHAAEIMARRLAHHRPDLRTALFP